MSILIIAGVIVLLVGVCFAAVALNDYSKTKYGYKPLNFWTSGLVTVPVPILGFAVFTVAKDQSFLHNGFFLAALALLIVSHLFVIILLLRKTSIGITLPAWLLLAILGPLLLFVFSIFIGRNR